MTTALAQRIAQADQGFVIEQCGLRLTRALASKEEWVKIGQLLRRELRKAEQEVERHQWATGDWINLHRGEWGETYHDASVATGYSYDFCRSMALAAKTFEGEVRSIPNVSFTHYRLAAALPLEKRREFLEKAGAERINSRTFQELVTNFNSTRKFTPGRDRQRAAVKATRKEFVCCPQCKHEFPIQGNRIKESK